MSIDILVLNHATVDIRVNSPWIKELVRSEGLNVNRKENILDYLDEDTCKDEITFGGSGNLAPLIARSGLKTGLSVNLGKGNFKGLDLHGRLFYDSMKSENIDLEHVCVHETLPTAATFIDDTIKNVRGGMVYFPNANDDVDFGIFREAVRSLNPKIIHYLYVGLSKKGDANNGRDLAEFLNWCNNKDIITSMDSHTLTPDVKSAVNSKIKTKEYELLTPILPMTDIFFTSSDESKIISNSLRYLPNYDETNENFYSEFLQHLIKNNLGMGNRIKLFGVTHSQGACAISSFNREISKPFEVKSKFSKNQIIDLVGAGDSFRAGMLTYVCRNLKDFKNGKINWRNSLQMGNLFASRFISSPLDKRYNSILSYEKMCDLL